MKKLSMILLISSQIFIYSCSKQELAKNAFFVSTKGNDSWSGKLEEPNNDHTDGPFATLQKAKQSVRVLKNSYAFPTEGLTIYIREGIYSLTETFQLSQEDSGLDSSPITWRAYPNEQVRFMGGKTISGFEKITNSKTSARFDPSYEDNILQVDLKKQGISDFGELKMTGMGLPVQATGLELFFKGKPMTLARFPNEGWLQIEDVPQSGKRLIHEGVTHTPKDGIPRGRHFGRFTYSGDRPQRWLDHQNIWMRGYWTWDWADAFIKVDSIDLVTHEIYPAEPHPHYGYTKEQHFYFVNIPEELDSPGEYYLDRESGFLYFWPPKPLGAGDAFVSILDEVMINMDSVSNISIEGIILEGSRASAIQIDGGKNNRIAGCTIRNIGNVGITINGGTNNGVLSCDIYETGDGGIRLSGGDRLTLKPGNNYATNNHITRFSRINLTYRHAIRVDGVGNLVSHNVIHDAPHEALYFSGNEHIIEYNEIYDVVKQTGDAGAIHTGRDYTWRGNIIRCNYFHHLHGPGLFGVMGVYLDDFMSATTVFGNLFYKAGRAAFLGGGRDNIIENNMFVDCEASVHIDARGKTWATYYFDGSYNTLKDRMAAMNYDHPPYSERYPELLTYYDDDPAQPKNNKVLRNISFSKKWLDIEDGVDPALLEMKDNLIADSILCYWRGPEVKDALVGTIHTREDQDFLKKLKGNQIISGNPGFVDIKNDNFQLKADSPAFILGFQKIPLEKIGLYTDEFRKTLPKRK